MVRSLERRFGLHWITEEREIRTIKMKHWTGIYAFLTFRKAWLVKHRCEQGAVDFCGTCLQAFDEKKEFTPVVNKTDGEV